MCILVAGMHRSGTSALTRVLGLVGAGLPRNPLKANAHNETGFWEPEPIVMLHEELLREIGSRWNDIGRLDISGLSPERLRHYKAEIIRILREEYGDSRVFVVKDPRICLLAPLWIEALTDAGIGVRFVLPLRDATEVARSLAARDLSSMQQGYLMWLRHLLEAERASRSHRRVFLHYSDLLQDPVAVAADLAARLLDDKSGMSAEAKRQVGLFVDGKLRHQVAETMGQPRGLDHWLAATHGAYAELVRRPDDEEAEQHLDLVRADFDRACDAFLPLIEPKERLLEAAAQEIAALKQSIADRDAALVRQAEVSKAFETALDEVYRSTSWRVTAPLRATGNLVKRRPT